VLPLFSGSEDQTVRLKPATNKCEGGERIGNAPNRTKNTLSQSSRVRFKKSKKTIISNVSDKKKKKLKIKERDPTRFSLKVT